MIWDPMTTGEYPEVVRLLAARLVSPARPGPFDPVGRRVAWFEVEEMYDLIVDFEEHPEAHHRPRPRSAEVLAAMPYDQYLRSPEWRARSRLKKNLAGYRCERCGRRETGRGPRALELNVHHLTYARRGFEDVESDLICLCRQCHEKEHGIR